jgi:hypothetical protein
MFQMKAVENTKTHIMFNNFFPKIVPFIEIMRKNIRAVQATDDNMVHALCMPDT